MCKRYVICTPDGDYYAVVHDFTADTWEAEHAFRTLYKDKPQHVLFEQIACSEPAGSCDEADDTSGEDSVHEDPSFYAKTC